MTKSWIDLSQTYSEGIPPVKFMAQMAMRITTVREGEDGTAHPNIQEFVIYSHQGTHVDAPRHLFRAGKTMDQLPLDCFAGPGVVLELPKGAAEQVTAADLESARPKVERGDIVVLHTGWEAKYRDDEYYENPHLSEDAAEWLVQHGVKMIAIDSISVDMPAFRRPPTFNYPVHRKLLSNGVLIAENLCNLAAVAGQRLTIAAFPLNIAGADGSPARIMALID